MQLVKHRSTLKNRVHSTLIAFGHQLPVADLFGLGGRRLLAGLDIPAVARPRRRQLEPIDDLELRIARIEAELKRSGADHTTEPGDGSTRPAWRRSRAS